MGHPGTSDNVRSVRNGTKRTEPRPTSVDEIVAEYKELFPNDWRILCQTVNCPEAAALRWAGWTEYQIIKALDIAS